MEGDAGSDDRRDGSRTGRRAGAVRIGLLGTLAVHDEAGRPVRVGGQRVRLLLILLALDAGKVVPAYALIERLWADEPPANSGNALQSLVSRLRTSLREAGLGDQVIESHPAGYRLAVTPEHVDAAAFEALARRGSQALAAGDPGAARQVLREALDAWRGPALADASGARFAVGPAARLEELRARAALDLIEAGLALGEGDSLIGELRAMIAADPVAERPRGLLMRALYAAGRQAEAVAEYAQARDLLATELGVDPSPQLEQIYLGVLRQDLPVGPAAGRWGRNGAGRGGRGADGRCGPAAPGPARGRAQATDQLRRQGRGPGTGAEDAGRGPARHADRPRRRRQDPARPGDGGRAVPGPGGGRPRRGAGAAPGKPPGVVRRADPGDQPR
jgi:DNA-binding SARP family transcriptional activator